MILVAGSTGFLGSEIVRLLCEQNKPVRALVRKSSSADKVARLESFGATTVVGDLTDRASLVPACEGIDTIITTATAVGSQTPGDTIPSVDQAGQLNLVDAAVQGGVSHFIYISSSALRNIRTPLPALQRQTKCRTAPKGSGMTYTILRPSFFMEAWLSPMLGFDVPNSKATIYGDGNKTISWISLFDVARFAVLAVDSPAARNAILELGGSRQAQPERGGQDI